MVTSEKWKKRSNANKSNRAKHVYSSNHGTKSYAQSRFDEETGTFPDLVEQFKKKHTKEGKWNSPVAEIKYNEMIEIREAQEGQEGTCLTDAQIVAEIGCGMTGKHANPGCCGSRKPVFSVMKGFGVMGRSGDVAPLFPQLEHENLAPYLVL
ncbi:ARID DNA-binding domain-containing protein [Tanacetum coccineum]